MADASGTAAAWRFKRPIALWMALIVVAMGIGAFRLAAYLRQPAAWEVGDAVDVEITLVGTDRTNLACASPSAVGDLHCAFEAPSQPWSNGGGLEDEQLLRPYTTTDRRSLLAAGMWSQEALKEPLPRERFSVKCVLAIAGVVKQPAVRWAPRGEFKSSPGDWFAGQVSDCQVLGPGSATPSSASTPSPAATSGT